MCSGPLSVLAGSEREPHVVLVVEAGEVLRVAFGGIACGAEVAANQPVPVERVEAELVDIDAQGEQERHGEAGQPA